MVASQNIPGDVENIGPVLPASRKVAKVVTAVIAKGDNCNLNKTSDLYETCPTNGIEPFYTAAKAADNGDLFVEVWEKPVFVYMTADEAIEKQNYVKRGSVTAGRVGQWDDGTDALNQRVGEYVLKGNVVPLQGDGVTVPTNAANNDLVLIVQRA
jgi:hypothetical protein